MTIRAIDIEGGFRGPYGYHRHLRGFVKELHRRGIAIHLYDDGDDMQSLPTSPWTDPLFATFNRPVGARVLLQSRMPHEIDPRGARPIVNLTTFEATRIPQSWVECSHQIALTVVTTEACRQAWLESGAPSERLRVCPLGFDPAELTGNAEPMMVRLGNGDRVDRIKHRFLNISAVGPRKNLPGLLRAWLRATSAQDDAVLILKLTFYGPADAAWYHHEFARSQEETGKRLDQAAPICTIIRTLRDAELPRLYAAATHYLSLSHGEGWDLPMMEAAASGLRLIAPDHSAYPTYLDSTVAQMVPSRVIPVVYQFSGPTAQLFEGTSWWEPDEDAAVAAIRAAIIGHDTPAASARDRMLRDFTWERLTDRLIAILDEAEAMAPPPRRFRLWPHRYSAL